MAKKTAEEILRAAETVFQTKGYQGATMAQIAKEAGISIRTLYGFFPGKERLFEKIGCPELKEYRPEDSARKNQILNAALTLFSQKGYSATTMDDVATFCSFSKTVLYQYFSSKEELFAAIFSNVDLFLEQTEPILKSQKVTLRQFLEIAGLYFLELFDDPKRLNLLRIVIGEIHSFPQIGEIMYRNTVDRAANEAARQLAIFAESQDMITTDYKLAARSYFGMLYSFVLTDQILCPSASQFTKEQIVAFAAELFEKGLTK